MIDREETLREENERNAHADATEDVPINPPPKAGLPKLSKLDVEDRPKKGGAGMEKALEMLEEYDEGVPKFNPDVPHHEE